MGYAVVITIFWKITTPFSSFIFTTRYLKNDIHKVEIINVKLKNCSILARLYSRLLQTHNTQLSHYLDIFYKYFLGLKKKKKKNGQLVKSVNPSSDPASEEYVVCTLHPDIAGGDDGENEEEEDEEERLHVVGRHALHAEENRLQQFALRRAEAVAQHKSDAAVVIG